MHEGETYLVVELDLEGRRAVVEPCDADFYTEAMGVSQVTPGPPEEDRDAGAGLHWCLGALAVQEQIIGFRRRRQVTDQDLGVEPLDLPDQHFETQGLWIRMGERETDLLADRGRDLMGSLHALEHALIAMAPLLVLCDERDLGGVSYTALPDLGSPAVFLYDGYPGGVGIARAGQINPIAVRRRRRS